MNWHQCSTEQALQELQSNRDGLSNSEAATRLLRDGPNRLRGKGRRTRLAILADQFKDVMILILLAAAVISSLIGDHKDTIVILVIVLLNAALGFAQEFRAESALEALKRLAAPAARVWRDRQLQIVPADQVVAGDVVAVEAGDMIPADLRLIESHSLLMEEAALTGESQPVEKSIAVISGAALSPGDRLNMVFKGSTVAYGRGLGLTVATGMNTELGRIALLLQEKSGPTPLQQRLADFGKRLSLAVLGICALLFVVGLMRGEAPLQMLLVSISLAVAAIPEALPAVVSIALALGARRLASRQALIRKLPAVETLGSVTYICSDKTGTLTQNRMTVVETYAAQGDWQGLPCSSWLTLAMLLNQDVRQSGDEEIGDPTELALLRYARDQRLESAAELQRHLRIDELPFDSERKRMTTVHRYGERFLCVTKGGVESLLAACADDAGAALLPLAEDMANRGMRVLAFGLRLLDQAPDDEQRLRLESELRPVGLAGMIDPPRDEARQAIADCFTAGITPVMITGDHPLTASAIAVKLGIMRDPETELIHGPQLAALDETSFEQLVERIRVYARVAPEQKLRIVRALQKKGHYVAMTGDGVNDAPALRRANIGVAMGRTGTDVSREAAHMVLLDDNFATISSAVREGRRIFDNIRKFIKYTMTSNSGEIWTIFLAPVLGLPIPLLPIHILWINLVTDGLPGLAFSSEPAEPDVMRRPPRKPTESIFADGMAWHILWVGLLMGGVCLVLQALSIYFHVGHWRTMVFTVLCLSQMGHALAIRSDTLSLFQMGLSTNRFLLGAISLTLALQLALIYFTPLHFVFNTQSLSPTELALCLALSSVVFWGVEAEKALKRRRRRTPPVASGQQRRDLRAGPKTGS
ncbi:MAG: cation-translocating P-type ATPase [Leptospirales bacterium]|nr:cation-translocating P-type ATPase [Leptospirales bacterium]